MLGAVSITAGDGDQAARWHAAARPIRGAAWARPWGGAPALVVTAGLAGVLVIGLTACGSSSRRPQLYPAGSDKDDGYGDLAQKSARLLTSDRADAPLAAPRRNRHAQAEGDPYGGDPYGGDAYGGGDAASAALPQGCKNFRRCNSGLPSSVSSVPRTSRYHAVPGLTGTIEGTVTWRGGTPPPLVTACGELGNSSVRVGPNRTVGGVLIYIEHVELGRPTPSYGRQAAVGGTVAKHGCTLGPALQIVTPLPAGVAIHGDATAAKLRVTQPSSVKRFELQEAGRVVIQAEPGVTRIEADDDSIGAAWVVAVDTPYYAITDDNGWFRIDELAAGSYDVTFWQPPIPGTVNGALVYGPPVITRRSIKVDPMRPARLDLALER